MGELKYGKAKYKIGDTVILANTEKTDGSATVRIAKYAGKIGVVTNFDGDFVTIRLPDGDRVELWSFRFEKIDIPIKDYEFVYGR